jgi:hypothetical protein
MPAGARFDGRARSPPGCHREETGGPRPAKTRSLAALARAGPGATRIRKASTFLSEVKVLSELNRTTGPPPPRFLEVDCVSPNQVTFLHARECT